MSSTIYHIHMSGGEVYNIRSHSDSKWFQEILNGEQLHNELVEVAENIFINVNQISSIRVEQRTNDL